MAFRILLTESESPLGATILSSFESTTFSLVCPSRDVHDWSDVSAVRALIEEARPAIVINTLAWSEFEGDVDWERQHRVLAECCRERDLTLVHLSSHEVFPGEAQEEALDEGRSPNPDSPAGWRHYRAEQLVAEVPRHMLLRLTWLIDLPGGMLDQVCEMLTGREEVLVTEAWRGCPLQMAEVGRVVLAMVHQVLCGAENWGVYHVHTSDSCSEAEFTDLVARLLQKMNVQTAPVVIVGVQQRWLRTNGWLSGNKCTNKFGIQLRSWRQGIKSRVQAWVDERRAMNSGDLFPEESAPPGADSSAI